MQSDNQPAPNGISQELLSSLKGIHDYFDEQSPSLGSVKVNAIAARLPKGTTFESILPFLTARQLASFEKNDAVTKHLEKTITNHSKEIAEWYANHNDPSKIKAYLKELPLLLKKGHTDFNAECTIGNANFYGRQIQAMLDNGDTVAYTKETQQIAHENFAKHFAEHFTHENEMPNLAEFGLSHRFDVQDERLAKLTTFHISDQKAFSEVDERSLAQMENLKVFKVKNCSMQQLPKNFGKAMKNLVKFSIAGNQITKLPDNIFEGSAFTLEHVNLGSNMLQELPSSLFKLKKLKTLKIHGNQFAAVEFTNEQNASVHKVEALPKLTKLVLDSNPLEKTFDFAHLQSIAPSLETLSARSTNVSRLQGVHKALKVVNFENCKIQHLSQGVARPTATFLLMNLDELNLTTKDSKMDKQELLQWINTATKDTRGNVKSIAVSLDEYKNALSSEDKEFIVSRLPNCTSFTTKVLRSDDEGNKK
jgi:Leucine-rich repeat (LRR) protein